MRELRQPVCQGGPERRRAVESSSGSSCLLDNEYASARTLPSCPSIYSYLRGHINFRGHINRGLARSRSSMFHVPLPNVRVAHDRAGVLTTILSALWCCHAADQILLLKFSVKADFNQFRLVHCWRVGRYGLDIYEGFSFPATRREMRHLSC